MVGAFNDALEEGLMELAVRDFMFDDIVDVMDPYERGLKIVTWVARAIEDYAKEGIDA